MHRLSTLATQLNKTVHLFEAAIDALSYATLLKLHGRSWQNENLLSLAGIYQPKKNIAESQIPAALARFLEDYPHIKSIVLHVNNDVPGQVVARALMAVMPKAHTDINRPPRKGKDVNDYILYALQQRGIKGVSTDKLLKRFYTARILLQ